MERLDIAARTIMLVTWIQVRGRKKEKREEKEEVDLLKILKEPRPPGDHLELEGKAGISETACPEGR